MRSRSVTRLAAGAALLLASVVVVPATAAAQGYVGKWAVNAAQCRLGQEVQNAPMVMTSRGYDQHEAHCRFTSVKQQGAAWRVLADCSVEGDKQKHTFTLSVSGDRLTMREPGRRAVTYRRCR